MTDVRREGSAIVTRRPVVIDVGAAGKGYLVDIVAGMLRNEAIGAFVVDGSGDLIHAGPEPLDVGLEHPSDPTLAIGVARLNGRALCASASNRRAWGSFHHIVDGRTGVPARDVIATWVVADDALTADGLATALFFTPAERLAASFDFSFVRMFADGRAEISSDFAGELFTIVAAFLSSEAGAQQALAQRRGEAAPTSASRYADGAYTATGRYGGGPSFITVTVTLKDGVVSDVSVRPHATVPRSLEFQRSFAAAVPRAVIGKPIDGLRVGKLAGSSSTPRGFNSALQQIKEKARQ